MSMRPPPLSLPLVPSSWGVSSSTDFKSKRETTHQKATPVYLDLVRAAARLHLIVHFNATVTGYFTLPHKLFTSTLPLGIYLGDFGSSLFFIVSGASLALTVPAEQSPPQFYKKGARGLSTRCSGSRGSSCSAIGLWRTQAASAGPRPSRWC